MTNNCELTTSFVVIGENGHIIKDSDRTEVVQMPGPIQIRPLINGSHQLVDGQGNTLFSIETGDEVINIFGSKIIQTNLLIVVHEGRNHFDQKTYTSRFLDLNPLS